MRKLPFFPNVLTAMGNKIMLKIKIIINPTSTLGGRGRREGSNSFTALIMSNKNKKAANSIS